MINDTNVDDWASLAAGRNREHELGRHRVRIGRTTSRVYAAEEFRPVLVLGPQRSYKTSGFAVPAILDWEGPAVITSVRHDVLDDTFDWRSKLGSVAVFDPSAALVNTRYSSNRYNWNVLAECRTWDGSVRTARALSEAGRAGGIQDGDFWFSAAAKLLTPHLFAASNNEYTMADVARWINTQEEFEVRSLLQTVGHEGAITSAEASWQREDRARSSIYTTAEQVIRVFEYEDSNLTTGPFLDLDRFLASSSNTLYICAPPDEQEEYKPLFTGLVRTLVRKVYNLNNGVADAEAQMVADDLDVELADPDRVHSRVGRGQAVAGVGSQGLPVRALWMASMARMWWPRALTR